MGNLRAAKGAVRYLDSGLSGQPFDGLGEGQALGFLDELEEITAYALGVAVPEAGSWIEREGGVFIKMKGTAAYTLTIEFCITADDNQRISGSEDGVKRRLLESFAPCFSCLSVCSHT